jgi:glutamate/tyrosine decarboxylase-like PLP-dependent enzyme
MKKNTLSIKNHIRNETFDLNPEELRQLGLQFTDIITKYYDSMCFSSIVPPKNLKQLKQRLNEPLPQQEMDLESLLLECQEKIVHNAVRFGHPRFLGWVLSSGTPIGAYAEGLAAALNQNVAMSGAGVATAVELVVLDWIKKILGYDSRAAGVLVSGGSMANLLALAVARNVRGGNDIRQKGLAKKNQMILYASSESHVCIDKAIDILGIGTDNIRRIKVDERFRVDVKDLKRKIKEDLAKGLHPFCVVATAGTVNTGAIDPLETIADICTQHNMWFHVDAAYGGFVAISPQWKSLLKGINRADSVAVDPHKWLFIPYDAGCVLVRNPKDLKKTFSYAAEYLPFDTTKPVSNDEVDFADYGIELTRSFRALKIWMSLKHYGAIRYGRMINQNMNLAQYWQALINESADFTLMAPSDLSVVCFCYVPEKLIHTNDEKTHTYLDVLQHAILSSLRKNKDMLLSGTTLKGRFVLRGCIVNYRTTQQDVKDIVEGVRKIGKKHDALLRPRYL